MMNASFISFVTPFPMEFSMNANKKTSKPLKSNKYIKFRVAPLIIRGSDCLDFPMQTDLWYIVLTDIRERRPSLLDRWYPSHSKAVKRNHTSSTKKLPWKLLLWPALCRTTALHRVGLQTSHKYFTEIFLKHLIWKLVLFQAYLDCYS